MAKPLIRSKNATELLHYAEQIFQKMKENEEMFPEPVPGLQTFETHLIAYRKAFAEASFRDQRAVILKGQAAVQLQAAIYRLSQYVDAVSEGDPAVIVASGYRVSQPRSETVGRSPKAEHLRVEHPQVGSGIVRLRVKAWRPARLYSYEYRQKGTESWTAVLASRSSLELHGLEMMKEYEFRVSYISTDTTMNYSDVITAFVV